MPRISCGSRGGAAAVTGANASGHASARWARKGARERACGVQLGAWSAQASCCAVALPMAAGADAHADACQLAGCRGVMPGGDRQSVRLKTRQAPIIQVYLGLDGPVVPGRAVALCGA